MRFYILGGRRFWQIFTGASLAFLVLSIFARPLANTVVSVVASSKLRPIYSVDVGEQKIAALTFDACWGNKNTARILEILARQNVKATFFLVNIWVKSYPEETKKIAAAGHEIGLHSATHPHFSRLREQQIEKELQANHMLIKETTGQEPRLFRFPYGDYNNLGIQVVGRLGYQAIQWSVDSLDWKDLGAEQIFDRVTKKIHPGAIVLLHNEGLFTAETLEPLIIELKRKGYVLVPAGEMVKKENYYVDFNGVQRSLR